MATKEQERKALEKIKKIVAELGEDSYIATALEGMFTDAEENIEWDAAFSMKSRWDEAEERARAYKSEAEESAAMVAQLKAENEALRAKVLEPDDMYDCMCFIDDRCCEVVERRDTAAADIIKYADDPDSDYFKWSVKAHRSAVTDIEYYDGLKARIKKAYNA